MQRLRACMSAVALGNLPQVNPRDFDYYARLEAEIHWDQAKALGLDPMGIVLRAFRSYTTRDCRIAKATTQRQLRCRVLERHMFCSWGVVWRCFAPCTATYGAGRASYGES